MEYTRLFFDLGCLNDGDPHSDSFSVSRSSSRTKRSTSFLNISSCTLGTGYGIEHISFASYFNLNSTGYFSRHQVFHRKNLRILQ